MVNFSKTEKILEKDIDTFYFLFDEKNKKNSGLIIDYRNYTSFSSLLSSFEAFFGFNKNCNFFDLDLNLKELYLKKMSIRYKKKGGSIIIKNSSHNTFLKLVKIFPPCWCIKKKETFDTYINIYGDFYIVIDKNSFYGLNIKKKSLEYSCFDLNNEKAKLSKFHSIRRKILGPKSLLTDFTDFLLLNSLPNLISFLFFSFSFFFFSKEFNIIIFYSVITFLACSYFYTYFYNYYYFDNELYNNPFLVYFLVWIFLVGFGFEFNENFPNPDYIISENPYIEYDFIGFSSSNYEKYTLTEKEILSDNFVKNVYEITKSSKVSIRIDQIHKYNIDMNLFEKIEENKYKGLKYNIYVSNEISGISFETDDRNTVISLIKENKDMINSMKNVYRLEFINNILTNFPDDEIQDLVLLELFDEKEREEFYKRKIHLKLE